MNEMAVVGGGLSGGAVATMLARAGKSVRLFERDAEPADKVCGEFLSVEAQRMVQRLGIDLDHLGASSITRLRLMSGRRRIEAALPFVARGVTRKRLDTVLLEHAAAAGAQVHRGVSVRAIEGDRIETMLGTVQPATLLLASGKHEVRGAARSAEGCDTGYVGFKGYWRLPPREREDLRGYIDVILFEGGYAGLQLVEGDLANLCLLVTKPYLTALGGTWNALLEQLLREPHAAAMLGGAEPLSPRPFTIAGVPYGFLQREGAVQGLFRLGDQAAVIPSFCGEGMAIALHSAEVAASVLLGGGTAADYAGILRRDVQPRLRLAMALQRGGQQPWTRALMLSALHMLPGLAGQLARLTRIPARHFV